ncbi:hypothetical protein NHX12_028960 [Muraenolepis orangiensis]|uniref:aspartate transaminase n=1 Tax=Muraenolepis orangiensis TaxID=630683 RepID=A0A9Q0EB88_9TELE|nr:hypothetical protein NHX12_028960 [Muraenolepis orangiensis]
MDTMQSVLGSHHAAVSKHTHTKTNLSVFVDTRAATAKPHTKSLSAFRQDNHDRKVNLSGGELKKRISADPTLCSPSPSSPFGLAEFITRATAAALGDNSSAIVENRVLGVQTVGFTGAVRLGAELLKHWYNGHACHAPVYLSSPCDESLAGIFQAAGMADVRQYRYWDAGRRGVCVDHLLEDLGRVPERSIVVLSASAHCPTGADLSREHWALITQLMMSRQLFPFLLLPAQGLCCGDLERDAWPVQYCQSLGMELLCAQSFSHCFGLYGEEVGHLVCVLKQSSVLSAVRSQTEKLIEALWARPPVGGARIVATVLSNPAHLAEWQEGVRDMAARCMLVRERLRDKLRLLGTPGCWDHLTQQTGLYCCTGLDVEQVEYLSKRKHIYLLPNGCLNVSAVHSGNLDYITESLHEALSSPLS